MYSKCDVIFLLLQASFNLKKCMQHFIPPDNAIQARIPFINNKAIFHCDSVSSPSSREHRN